MSRNMTSFAIGSASNFGAGLSDWDRTRFSITSVPFRDVTWNRAVTDPGVLSPTNASSGCDSMNAAIVAYWPATVSDAGVRYDTESPAAVATKNSAAG